MPTVQVLMMTPLSVSGGGTAIPLWHLMPFLKGGVHYIKAWTTASAKVIQNLLLVDWLYGS